MDAVYERCCGLDVGQQTVVACLLSGDGKADSQTDPSYRTM
jgi:hypothetical protein